MEKVIVISNLDQYRAFDRLSVPIHEWTVVCDNPRFFSYLKDRGIPFKELSIVSIRDLWCAINSWSCDRASQWIRFCRERKLFPHLDAPSHLHHRFSYFLVHMIKSRYLAIQLMADLKPEKVAAGFPVHPSEYPQFL